MHRLACPPALAALRKLKPYPSSRRSGAADCSGSVARQTWPTAPDASRCPLLQQSEIASKGTPADDELPKAASLARLLSYASRTSSGMTAFPSGDIDAAEKGGSVFTRIKRHVRTPKRASLQVRLKTVCYR